MIELFFFPSPNGMKIAIMLEECELPYKITLVDITKGDQFHPDFIAISPNTKIPAITVHDTKAGSLTLFESGAILLYLANRTGRFFPPHGSGYYHAMQWLFWQIGHLGPMAGQAHYFREFCEIRDSHAIERFTSEMNRLYDVLNRQLENQDFIAGEYSIVDMACWPWIKHHHWQGQNLEDFPAVNKWFERVGARTAVKRAETLGTAAVVDRESYRNILHNQTAEKIEKLSKDALRRVESDNSKK